MSEHEHDWKPWDGHYARYLCACGATGYKPNRGTARERANIVAHKQPQNTATVNVRQHPAHPPYRQDGDEPW
jgi:CDGSH-type Zn-finger protein